MAGGAQKCAFSVRQRILEDCIAVSGSKSKGTGYYVWQSPDSRGYFLFSSSFLEYFVPCRVNWRARPFFVIWYTHTPGDTEAAPE